MFDFLVKVCKSRLKVALAFSPVGDAFRKRAVKFPGLINCTIIDKFHPWPRDALVGVAERFLGEIEMDNPETNIPKLAAHMAESIYPRSRRRRITSKRRSTTTSHPSLS